MQYLSLIHCLRCSFRDICARWPCVFY